MGTLKTELRRIFKKNPLGIIFVLIMDIAETACLFLNPRVIGLCIDGFLEHNYFWFYILIFLQVLITTVRAINKYFDNRVYEPIIEDESNLYYEKHLTNNINLSEISSRLNLVHRVPEFFENDLVQIVDIISSIFSPCSSFISLLHPYCLSPLVQLLY